MSRYLLALLALLVPLAGPAMAAEQGYSVTDFSAVRMLAPFRVVIATGGGNSARATGERDALDRVSLEVSGGVLTIRALPPRFGQAGGNPGRATIFLGTPTLRRVQMSGSGSLTVQGMKGVSADISLAGGGDLDISGIAVDRLVVGSAGAGRIRLSGRAGEARLSVIGAGSVDAAGLTARAAEIVAQGPGDIVLTATGTAGVKASGSGGVTVLGHPACTVSGAGGGTIRCGDGLIG